MLALDLPQIFDTLPDIGGERLKHVRVLTRQALQLILQGIDEAGAVLGAESGGGGGQRGVEVGEVEVLLVAAHRRELFVRRLCDAPPRRGSPRKEERKRREREGKGNELLDLCERGGVLDLSSRWRVVTIDEDWTVRGLNPWI